MLFVGWFFNTYCSFYIIGQLNRNLNENLHCKRLKLKILYIHIPKKYVIRSNIQDKMKKLTHEHLPTLTPRFIKNKPIKKLKTHEKPQGVGFFFRLDSAEIGGKKPHPPGVFPEKPLFSLGGPAIALHQRAPKGRVFTR